ncbi:CidA/LrgA family protein [Deinococcus irradiatisoli]|uniref:CidA/LrgA family protein n=1 Tax=Deinococcus irradiatisoli TaxID=2202254 RepID=UPI001FE37C75|nr:CidA/LrgA family protein [Deinococcus irradiatisoli]
MTPLAAWLRGLGLLLAFAALGDALVRLSHLPVPGSVLGLLLLWLALGLGWVKLGWLEAAADHLLGILGLLFVPATVGFVGYLSAGAAWGWWLLVMLSGLLVGAGVAGLLAARLVRSGPEEPGGGA